MTRDVPIHIYAEAAIAALDAFTRQACACDERRHYEGSIQSRVFNATAAIKEFAEIVQRERELEVGNGS